MELGSTAMMGLKQAGRAGAAALLALALASAAAAQGAPANARSPEALRCVLDGLSQDVRAEVGLFMWDQSHSRARAIAALAAAADACARRYGWDERARYQSGNYAASAAAAGYFRTRLAELGLDVDAWDAAYARLPLAIRSIGAASGDARDDANLAALDEGATAAVAADPNAGRDPQVAIHAFTYFLLRAEAESTELYWAELRAGR